jgi:cyanophycin synthetase
MNLLKKGALDCGRSEEHLHLIAGERQSTAAALAMGRPGDLVVVTPTDVKGAWQQVNEFKPANARSTGRSSFAAAE